MSEYAPKYATITLVEINHLMERNAPKNALPVLLVLNAFCMDGFSCFPSITTIRKHLNYSLSVRTVQKVLKWLADNLVIERNNKKSKSRWVNLLRKMVYGQSGEKDIQAGLRPKSEDVQIVRKDASKSFAIREESEKNILTSVCLLKQGDGKQTPKKSRSIQQKLSSAKRRVQRYTNLLNNREEPVQADNGDGETRSVLSYWMACYKLGQPIFDGSDEQLHDIVRLYDQNETVRNSLLFYPKITEQIQRFKF